MRPLGINDLQRNQSKQMLRRDVEASSTVPDKRHGYRSAIPHAINGSEDRTKGIPQDRHSRIGPMRHNVCLRQGY